MKDFRWLSEENPEAYDALILATNKVIDAPGNVYGISSALGISIKSLKREIFGDSWLGSNEVVNVDEAKQAIENYIQEADSVLNIVGQELCLTRKS
ncbi:hypothetical protein ACSYAD_33455 [Acaryochloris marina NIES-2412]|uniref:hypothetical protein n=1 Tax=Acaryochloris marina TaxID=155978 RepID=UPI004059C81C